MNPAPKSTRGPKEIEIRTLRPFEGSIRIERFDSYERIQVFPRWAFLRITYRKDLADQIERSYRKDLYTFDMKDLPDQKMIF